MESSIELLPKKQEATRCTCKDPIPIRKQVRGRVEFRELSFVQDHHFVAIDDCVQPMCHSQNRALRKLLTDRGLNERISLHVDARRSFVQHENLSESNRQHSDEGTEATLPD